jgi:hypothetical protein
MGGITVTKTYLGDSTTYKGSTARLTQTVE